MARAVMQPAGTKRAVHWKSLRTSVLLSAPALIRASAPHLCFWFWFWLVFFWGEGGMVRLEKGGRRTAQTQPPPPPNPKPNDKHDETPIHPARLETTAAATHGATERVEEALRSSPYVWEK